MVTVTKSFSKAQIGGFKYMYIYEKNLVEYLHNLSLHPLASVEEDSQPEIIALGTQLS